MVTIEDVNSRTLLQQFHALYENQKETQSQVDDISSDLSDEVQNRTNADADLQGEIDGLQAQLDGLGTIFTLKGSVNTVADLPSQNNNVGDVYYVKSESAGYIWLDDEGTLRWEQLGFTIDLSNYATQTDLSTGIATKQDKLTAGTNISIIGNTISAQQPDTSKFEMLSGVTSPSTSTVGAVGQKYHDTTKGDIYICTAITDNGDDTFSYTWLLEGGNGKQNKLTAGTNVSISGDVISASGGLSEVKASDINSESATSGQVLTANGTGGASFGDVPAPSGVVKLDTSEQTFDGSKKLIIGNSFTLSAGTSKYLYYEKTLNRIKLFQSTAVYIGFDCYNSSPRFIYRGLGDTEEKSVYLSDIGLKSQSLRYIHHIRISNSTLNAEIMLTIPSKSSTAFTYSTLLARFNTIFTSLTDKIAYQCSGMETGRSVSIWRCGTDGTNICGFSDQILTFAEADTTLVDTVETL